MAKNNGNIFTDTSKKKTAQGSGVYTKTTDSGGETYYDNIRAGSPPTRAHRRRKRYRGQGR